MSEGNFTGRAALVALVVAFLLGLLGSLAVRPAGGTASVAASEA